MIVFANIMIAQQNYSNFDNKLLFIIEILPFMSKLSAQKKIILWNGLPLFDRMIKKILFIFAHETETIGVSDM